MARTLFGISSSPWTERARWALDHHRLAYEYREHLPMLGEFQLRRRARTKNASVPLLIDGDDVVMGSTEIARAVDARGQGAPLFSSEHAAEVERWSDLAERMVRVGRASFVQQFLARPDAQTEALPAFVPGPLRRVLAPGSAMAVRFLAKKYDVVTDVAGEIERTLRPALFELRRAVSKGPYVITDAGFSFADLTLATALHAVRPHATLRSGPAFRSAWANEELASEFADLLAWRDAIYEKHRARA